MSSGGAEAGAPPGSPEKGARDPLRDPLRELHRDPGAHPPIPAPRAIQLTVKYPTFSWEGETHQQFKCFKHRTEILMEGPYEDYKEPDKVAAI